MLDELGRVCRDYKACVVEERREYRVEGLFPTPSMLLGCRFQKQRWQRPHDIRIYLNFSIQSSMNLVDSIPLISLCSMILLTSLPPAIGDGTSKGSKTNIFISSSGQVCSFYSSSLASTTLWLNQASNTQMGDQAETKEQLEKNHSEPPITEVDITPRLYK